MSVKGRRRGGEAAFTLVEVMVAVFVLIVAFFGIYATTTSCATLRETAHETNMAMFKLQSTMEYIFIVPFDEVTTLFPEGTPVDVADFIDSMNGNGTALNNEAVSVSYDDPNADPLYFTVTINWDSRYGTPRSESISSARAR